MTFLDDVSFKGDNQIMKILKLRWRGLLFVAAVTTLLLLLYHNVRYNYDCNGPYWEISSLQHLNEYCNFISEPVSGAEGQVPSSQYQLISVHVVTRHGDRYNLHSLPNYENAQLGCLISEELKAQVMGMDEYQQQMQRLAEQGGRLPSQTFHAYNLYPNSDMCKVGQLTPQGAAQHLKNGHHLKASYQGQWKLVNDSKKWDQILVRSTTKSRTFQSALALMLGFAGELDLSKLQLEEAMNNSMCSASTGYPCGCLATEELIDLFSCVYHQLSPHMMAQPKVRKAYLQISKVLNVASSSLPRPSHIMDVIMIHYCHHLPLPHRSSGCIQPWVIADVYNAVNQNGRDLHLDQNLMKIVRLKLQPLLFEIAHRMREQLLGKSPLKFVLYSGHDSTIEPLANALGFSTGTWPRYASRIVLELYKKRTGAKGYVRILYDGKPVTDQVIFCSGRLTDKKYSLCSLTNFLNFVDHDNIHGLNEESYEKACQNIIQY